MPAREAQALREIGQTDITKRVAVCLVVLFLLTISATPFYDAWYRWSGGLPAPMVELVVDVAGDLRAIFERGLLETNRRLKRHMDSFETGVEEESWLRRRFVPSVQWRLATGMGLGSEQVYVGRDGWLFYRADVDHVVGRGFLEPKVLGARSEAGDLWQSPPQPDPIRAIEVFVRGLEERGVRTILLPTPVKPTIEPEFLTSRAKTTPVPPVHNASFGDFVARLEELGLEVFDPAPLLVDDKRSKGRSQYLRTDTHWTPQAVVRVARELARSIEARTSLSTETVAYRRRTAVLEGLGDIAAMLELPKMQQRIPAERIEAEIVLAPDGTAWSARRSAEVLVVGDSFTNVFSDAGLGWGSGAGLAEQLAYELEHPTDKIAVNAGGARGAREALRRVLAADAERLASTRVLIYQFASRELSQGDWRIEPPLP